MRSFIFFTFIIFIEIIFRSYIIVCETVYFQANMPFSVKIEGINYKYRAIRKYDTSEIDHDFTKYGIHIL